VNSIIAAAVGGILGMVALVGGVSAYDTGAEDPAKAADLYTYADN